MRRAKSVFSSRAVAQAFRPEGSAFASHRVSGSASILPIDIDECLTRVVRAFRRHNAPSSPRSQSATGVEFGVSAPLLGLPPVGESVSSYLTTQELTACEARQLCS